MNPHQSSAGLYDFGDPEDLMLRARDVHAALMEAGEEDAAQRIRKAYFALDDEIRAARNNPPLSPIPKLEPLTCVVRELRPELWSR